jgi:hypothetical protein
MMLTGMADALRGAGLKVVEQSGWKTRGHGSMTNVHGLTVHHTASGRSARPKLGLDTVEDGRPGLDGPLAHLYLDVDGTWYVVAAGLCYHAGVSLKEDYENDHRIGVECHAAGDGWSEDWPEVQMESLALGAKALADHYDFGVEDILGHKETCSPRGRKVDPSFSMNEFRDMVKEIDVLTSADKAWIKNAILDALKEEKFIPNTDQDGNVTSWMTLARFADLTEFKNDRNNVKLDDILRLLTPAAPAATKK